MKKANLMIVGTSSGAGKSLFVTALIVDGVVFDVD